ncbi:hypothetical protein LEMLEM_LOCUS17403 [Lemmus lemmus]
MALDRVIVEAVSRGFVKLCTTGWLPKDRDGKNQPLILRFPTARGGCVYC